MSEVSYWFSERIEGQNVVVVKGIIIAAGEVPRQGTCMCWGFRSIDGRFQITTLQDFETDRDVVGKTTLRWINDGTAAAALLNGGCRDGYTQERIISTQLMASNLSTE